MDLRPQNSRKSPIPTLERLALSSCYFLKRSKIDISQNMTFFLYALSGVPARLLRNVRGRKHGGVLF